MKNWEMKREISATLTHNVLHTIRYAPLSMSLYTPYL